MTTPQNSESQFLSQLYTLTNGDLSAQHSMHDVGAAVGLDKEQSGKIAENLIGQGLVEIKTLSGGVGITAEGVEAVQASGAPSHSGFDLSLGNGRIIESEGRTTVDHLLSEIKSEIAKNTTSYPQLEAMVVDIKTIETHMLSPQPKVIVIRELFRSLQETLSSSGPTNIAALVEKLINT